jgi:2-polyprenyl-3-methyl-5-hydroxy-6-metoxy-1,4-benzoquinol methylase
MISYFDLKPGHKVLDLMCGYGRHSIALAKEGIAVTALDNLEAYVNEIRETASKENLPVEAIQGTVTGYEPSGQFDLVICMGNSLNFFAADDVTRIFSMVARALKPGGHFLINSWSLAEIIFRNFKEENDGVLGGMEFSTRSKVLFHPTRMESVTTMKNEQGATEVKTAIDYIYSINEMETLCKNAGLKLEEVYSIPGKKLFGIGEPRAYLVIGR